MLADEANMQKQKKREEQVKRWKEREMIDSSSIEGYKKLIGNSKETKVKFPKGCIFLAACSSADTDEVKQHLKLGVNINTTNIDGLTALHQACIDANQEMVKFLVENNADINAQDNEGWTPLHAAVSVGNLEVAKYLMQKGAQLNICNNDSDLPIDLCDSTNVQMKEYLEDEMRLQSIDAEFEKQREEMIMYDDAQEMNFKDKIHQKTGATPLHVSASKGYLRVIKVLVQCGANVNACDKDGWTPLHAAAHWGQEEACKILAENGANFEAMTYSGQTPFDVCDKEMLAKLKILQTSSKQQQNEAEATAPQNKQEGVGCRLRRQSDDINNKSSITRLTNEAKSSISEREKKQDKILLSPISSSTSLNKPQFDLYSNNSSNTLNSDSDNDKSTKSVDEISEKSNSNTNIPKDDDRFIFDKENLNRPQQLQPQEQDQPNKHQVLSKSNSLNKPKTGLHETLKSLSVQVKMKMDEDEIIDKQISSTNRYITDTEHINNINKAQTTAPKPANTGSPSSTATNSSSSLNPSATLTNTSLSSSTNNSTRPYLERRWGGSSGQSEPSTYKRRVGPNTNGTQQQSPVTSPTSTDNPSLDLTSPSNRRYSSAPIASKDEQAELIRKQKAKLERHFRRSTQAVSYEDIKSAEATIKGNNTTLNQTQTQPNSPQISAQIDPLNQLNQSSISNASITPASTSSITSFSFNTSSMLATVPVNSPPVSQQGVSNLSSIFGEIIKSQSSSSNLSALGSQSTTPTTNAQPAAVATNSSGHESNNEKDTIIANDIETDKLLNVIEKSKGFSDSYSTTATRRLRNRGMFQFNTNGGAEANNRFSQSVDDAQSSANIKKINKLIWNEEKCEIEYKDKEEESMATNGLSHSASGSGLNLNSNLNQRQSLQLSPSSALKRQNSGLSIENQALGAETLVQQSTNSRQMHRFGQNENLPATPSTANTPNNLGTRPGIKRSVSQVPSTDRRALNQFPTTTTNNTISQNSFNATASENEAPVITDFKAAYEQMKKENDILNQTILKLQRDLEEQNKKSQMLDSGSMDKREKRTFERRISELEEEAKKVDNLKQDNNRLKEENAALIRVISKLSK